MSVFLGIIFDGRHFGVEVENAPLKHRATETLPVLAYWAREN
jgi:hypothetical protein